MLEPVPETFALVLANVLLFRHSNVTLLNIAASDRSGIADMQIPPFETGLNNYYQAKLLLGRGTIGARSSDPIRGNGFRRCHGIPPKTWIRR